jgi:hypothetical protein
VVLAALAPQLNLPPDTAQLPFDDVKVNWSPEAEAVKPAQVPVVYQVPLEMMQPFLLPPVMTLRYPLPLNGEPVPPVGVDEGAELAEELGGPELAELLGGLVLADELEGPVLEDVLEGLLPPPPPDFGRYLTELPVQVEAVKESAGTNCPVCRLPRTL